MDIGQALRASTERGDLSAVKVVGAALGLLLIIAAWRAVFGRRR
jgi:ABC-type Na+ efflux pump permease subunit